MSGCIGDCWRSVVHRVNERRQNGIVEGVEFVKCVRCGFGQVVVRIIEQFEETGNRRVADRRQQQPNDFPFVFIVITKQFEQLRQKNFAVTIEPLFCFLRKQLRSGLAPGSVVG